MSPLTVNSLGVARPHRSNRSADAAPRMMTSGSRPLFDTSALDEANGTVVPEVGTPMRSNPGLTDTGDIDDPVSGGGNPALMEVPPPSGKQEKQP